VLVALAWFQGQAPGELARLVRRLVLLIDLPAAKAREQQATAGRRVRFYPDADADGQAVLHARGPLAMIAAIKASLEATVAEPAGGDGRCRDEREFDLFVDLLTGSQTPSGWHAHIVVPFSTALGGEVELADVPGFGPILPSTAHDLLDDAAALTPIAVDQDGTVFAVGDPLTPTPAPPAPAASRAATPDALREAILAMGRVPATRSHGAALGTGAYRVPVRVQRFLEARDRTACSPAATAPPASPTRPSDGLAGRSDPWNLQCLCRHHHRAKQAVFTVEVLAGDYRWTTRGGWQFWRRHQGY
jgi:hypothetical protein